MLFTEIPRRWSDDRSFTDYNFAVLLDGLPHVVLAHEVDGLLGTLYSLRDRRTSTRTLGTFDTPSTFST